MKAMILKEFRQMRRDRRTVALMVGLPLMLLVIFGYAARFDVTQINTVVFGSGASELADQLPEVFDVGEVSETADAARAETMLRDSEAAVVFLVDADPPLMMVDGTELFVAQSALRRVPLGVQPKILFNPKLDTAQVMVPALIGFVLLFVGTVITSLGVVREREQGTLEQLAVMPLRPVDVIVGKIAPYFLVAVLDMIVVTAAGVWLFDVPFRGSIPLLIVFGFVFIFVVLGLGVAISTVSKSQGEAIQLAIMTLLPQIMLSGMIFPLASMATWVRWIGYGLPLTWFNIAARGIFLKDSGLGTLLFPLAVLILMAVVVFGIAMLRFHRDLAPKRAEAAPVASGLGAPRVKA